MNRFTAIITILICLLLNSCRLINYYKAAKVKHGSYILGTISDKEFEFEIINGLMVLPVLIQGKIYHFLFDTGAGFVIDHQLLKEIEFENITKLKVEDSNDNLNSLRYVKISELSCFGTTFKEQGALVMDFEKLLDKSCLKISGIIGASVVKDLIVQINFEKQVIKISDEIKDFSIDSNFITLPFHKNFSESPLVEMNFNGNKEKLLLDTGSGSTFRFASTYLDSINSEKKLTAIGQFGGVFGAVTDSIHFLSGEVKLRENKLEKWQGIIEIRNSLGKGIIGLGFLKDYLVTIDWIEQNLHLKRIKQNNKQLQSYGFQIGRSGHNLVVSRVEAGSKAYDAGFKLDDVIIQIDNYEFPGVTNDHLCHFISMNYLSINQVDIHVKLLKEENTIVLSKELIFE